MKFVLALSRCDPYGYKIKIEEGGERAWAYYRYFNARMLDCIVRN